MLFGRFAVLPTPLPQLKVVRVYFISRSLSRQHATLNVNQIVCRTRCRVDGTCKCREHLTDRLGTRYYFAKSALTGHSSSWPEEIRPRDVDVVRMTKNCQQGHQQEHATWNAGPQMHRLPSTRHPEVDSASPGRGPIARRPSEAFRTFAGIGQSQEDRSSAECIRMIP